jgi:hypothetical protein
VVTVSSPFTSLRSFDPSEVINMAEPSKSAPLRFASLRCAPPTFASLRFASMNQSRVGENAA